MAVKESNILKRWLLDNARRYTMFRNNTGRAWAGKVVREWTEDGQRCVTIKGAYLMAFGLFKGAGDYIGWETVKITPDMVGQHIAVFTSLEGKTKNGVLSPDQKTWDKNVTVAGGKSIIVRGE